MTEPEAAVFAAETKRAADMLNDYARSLAQADIEQRQAIDHVSALRGNLVRACEAMLGEALRNTPFTASVEILGRDGR